MIPVRRNRVRIASARQAFIQSQVHRRESRCLCVEVMTELVLSPCQPDIRESSVDCMRGHPRNALTSSLSERQSNTDRGIAEFKLSPRHQTFTVMSGTSSEIPVWQ